MKERVLQYLWKYRLYDEADLRTTTGDPVTVIDPGLTNTDAGADFFNAKLRIAGTVWAGDIEIHSKASDWIRHGHDICWPRDNRPIILACSLRLTV